MRLIRGFEDLVQSLFLRGEIYGTTHLYSGQEAVAVGFASVLEERDRVAATYRGHGHALALGVDPQALLDEMLGRATGINGGRAGSMNVTSPKDRLIGCFGIVGGSIAAATGAALALKRTGGVAVAYFGDGAMNQGYFFECLNFCKVLSLPIVFVCENNGYGEYTPFEDVTAGRDPRARRGDGGAGRDDRRHERLDGARRGARARSSTRAPAAGRTSSRRSRTASSATRAATPASTGPRASSTAGASATRSSCSARSSRRRASRRATLDEIDAAVAAQLSRARGARARRAVPRAARVQRVQGLTWRAS